MRMEEMTKLLRAWRSRRQAGGDSCAHAPATALAPNDHDEEPSSELCGHGVQAAQRLLEPACSSAREVSAAVERACAQPHTLRIQLQLLLQVVHAQRRLLIKAVNAPDRQQAVQSAHGLQVTLSLRAHQYSRAARKVCTARYANSVMKLMASTALLKRVRS